MRKRTFFKAFFITLGIMLACYAGLYISMDKGLRQADTPRPGIPINRPRPGDSRTIFAAVGDENRRFFFLVKFNGFQSKVSVISISPSYIYPTKGRSLTQSMEMAGIMQRVLDTKEEFGINIDNYINCTWDGARNLMADFTEFGVEELGRNFPQVIQSLLLKSRENLDADSMINAVELAGPFLDNEIGLAFLNEGVYLLMKYNLENIYRYASLRIKANYNSIETNINTAALKDYERVLDFMDPTITEYPRRIVPSGLRTAGEKIRETLSE